MPSIKELLFINDSLSNKLSYYHLLLLLASLPFDQFYSHLIIISFAIHTLLHVTKQSFAKLLNPAMLLLQSVFWMALICVSYTAYKQEAYAELGRQMVILIMPVMLALTSFDLKKYKERLLTGFALCCTLTVAYLYIDAFRIIHYYHYPLKAVFTAAFTNHNFSDPIGMHATFFSFQVGLALVYLLSLLFEQAPLLRKIGYAVCYGVLFLGLIQLSSKSAFAAVLLSAGFVVPFFLLNGKKRMWYIATSAILAIGLITLISTSATFRERFINDLEKDMTTASKNEISDPRLARWGLALNIIGQSPVIGHGSGSEIPLLKDTYFDHQFYNSFLNGLNAHNEYLSFLIKSGVIGLLVYLATLAYGFRLAIINKDVVFFTFMLLIAVVSLSENVLDVDKGTIFYGVFFSFFACSANKKSVTKHEDLFDHKATLHSIKACYV